MSTVNLQWDYNALTWAIWEIQQGLTFPLGWTDKPILQPGNKIVYVSNSGNDSNDGLTDQTAKATIDAAANLMIAGDRISIERGSEFLNQDINEVPNGASSNIPSIIESHGTGVRPRLRMNNGGFTWTIGSGRSNIWVFGIEMVNADKYHDDPLFNPTNPSSSKNIVLLAGAIDGLLFEDCKFEKGEVVIQGYDGGEVSNVRLNRNIWTGAYWVGSTTSQLYRPSNLYLDNVITPLICTENVFDLGGWDPEVEGAGANIYNHNVYHQSPESGRANENIYYNNISTRASSIGLMIRPGGYMLDCFMGRNAIGGGGGTDVNNTLPMQEGEKFWAVNCVSCEAEGHFKGKTEADRTTNADGLRNGALWHIRCVVTANSINAKAENCIASQWGTKWYSYIPGPFPDDVDMNGQGPEIGCIGYKAASSSQGTGEGYSDPDRLLGDYYDHLQSTGVLASAASAGFFDTAKTNWNPVTEQVDGEDSFDKYMNIVKNRIPGEWDDAFSANGINNYIRAGFDLSSVPISNVIVGA